MYKKEFLLNLSNPKSNHFVLFGACDTSVDYYSDVLAKSYAMQEVLRVDFEEYDFDKCKEYLELDSLFDENKLLFIKANKLPPTKELKALISSCSDTKKMIIALYGVLALPDIAKTTTNFVRFFLPQNLYESVDFLYEITTKEGLMLDKSDLQVIYDSLNQDLFLSYCEIKKYKDFKPTHKFIQAQCGSEFDISFDLFFDDLLHGKNIEKNLSSYLFFSMINEVYAYNMILNQFLRIFRVKLGLLKGLSITDILGYNPPKNVSSQLIQWSNILDLQRFDELFSILLECEKDLKLEQKDLKKELLFAYILQIFMLIQRD